MVRVRERVRMRVGVRVRVCVCVCVCAAPLPQAVVSRPALPVDDLKMSAHARMPAFVPSQQLGSSAVPAALPVGAIGAAEVSLTVKNGQRRRRRTRVAAVRRETK